MVAKIDVSEALAAWRFSSSIIMAFVAVLLAAALAGTGFIWQRRQKLAYQALYQAEETLRQSEEKYRTILREIADSYFEVDLAGNLTFVNDAACRNLRYSREELLGMNYRGFAAEESIEHVYQAFNAVYRTGEPNKGFLWKLIRKDGSIGFADTSASLLRSQTGEIIGFRGVGRDVTERKMAEEERKQLELKAQMTSRLASVGEMAAGVAHEINNPLTGVIGYAQYLVEREDIPPDIRSELAAINDGARRVAGIVQRLLAFSRQTEPERKLVDINELIESTLVLRAYHLRVNNIEVVTRLAPDLLETVADPGQIQQVLLNLIVNAEKEMKLAHGKGKLTITTEKSDNTIKICCQDDGPGIKPEVMDRIFDPFFTTSEVGQGTGLGLSLCYGIVAEHKGKIYAESKPGKGATFIIELPVVTEAKPPKPAEPVVKKSRKAVKARILVVDDEQVVRDVVNRVLIGEGHMPEGKQKLEKGTANEEMKHRATALTNSTTLDQSSDAVTSKLAEKAEKRPPSKQRVAG
jgi:PAS domain S-box-containing protein